MADDWVVIEENASLQAEKKLNGELSARVISLEALLEARDAEIAQLKDSLQAKELEIVRLRSSADAQLNQIEQQNALIARDRIVKSQASSAHISLRQVKREAAKLVPAKLAQLAGVQQKPKKSRRQRKNAHRSSFQASERVPPHRQ